MSLPRDFRTLSIIAASDYPLATLILGTIGAAAAASFVLRVIIILSQTFLIPGKRLEKFGAKNGAWAVVTGATDGIGREFALQLAGAGFNVFLASRSPGKLDAVAAEIGGCHYAVFTETRHGVRTQSQAIDFSKADDPAWQQLADMLSPLDIGVLVNNVGKSHDIPTDFVETPEKEIRDILEINICSTLKVTSIVLPGLIARKRGLILNLGSFSGSVPSPMLATYSSSKAFLSTWTQALAKEVESDGISVRLLNAYFVVSSMSKIRRSSFIVPTSKAFVRAALSKIGVSGGALGKPYTSTPYWSHSLADAVITGLNWPSLFIAYTLRLHKDIRRKALRKRQRDAAVAKKE